MRIRHVILVILIGRAGRKFNPLSHTRYDIDNIMLHIIVNIELRIAVSKTGCFKLIGKHIRAINKNVKTNHYNIKSFDSRPSKSLLWLHIGLI